MTPIRFFHREKQTVEIEHVYGERWVRWAYETGLGNLALATIVRRALLSCIYGWQMDCHFSAKKVLPFIVKYGFDVDEFVKSPFSFRSFNDFFCRALKFEARPIAPGERVAVLPADGRHLAFTNVNSAESFYAKGQKFSLENFLGDAKLAREFASGSLLISRLCPVDYHRFHLPVSGVLGEPSLINGWLYSVSPVALRRNIAYLWKNKRMVTLVESPVFGHVAMVEIGATMVGSVLQTLTPGQAVEKGVEKGLFKFGGSCVVTIFQSGRIRFDDDLVQHSAEQLEVYAKMGERFGEAP